MISALLFAAAAGNFMPPSFTPDDVAQLRQSYPAAQSGQAAAAVIDARVDPKGNLSDCKALTTSGDVQLAKSICDHLKAIRIEPASVSGASSYGVVRRVLSLGLNDGGLRDPSDMELQVNKLPAGQSGLRVVANVVINAEGKPEACYAANDAPKAYADVACSQITPITFGVLKDDGGKPVRYVREVVLDFSTSAPTGPAPSSGG